MICEKRLSVPFKSNIGGTIVDVCKDCIKYGKKTDIIEVDKMTLHIPLIRVIEIKKD
jgi:ribosome-binding protein aMBF1 (putative translation factor)